MKINACCTYAPDIAAKHCDKVYYCGSQPQDSKSAVVYKPFSLDTDTPTVYLPTITEEGDFESFCDHVISTDAKAMVRAAYDLEEAGIVEARYKLSPIMLLHKMGVLDRCIIVGGVCLDNDDLDLMAQECVPLVVTPTASAGYGNGFAPVCAAVKRGIRVGIGTFDGKYNPSGDIRYEAEFMRLTANAEMRSEDALTRSEIEKILSFESNT